MDLQAKRDQKDIDYDDDDKNDDGEDRVVIMIGVEQELVGRRGNLGETSNSVEVYFLPFQFLFNPYLPLTPCFCTVPKRVPILGTFLTLLGPIGSLFILQGPYFQCFG